jgi:hypothetical protein
VLKRTFTKLARALGLMAGAPRIPTGLLDHARGLQATWPTRLAALRASGVPLAAYDNIISRTDAGSLIPEEVSNAMLTRASRSARRAAPR